MADENQKTQEELAAEEAAQKLADEEAAELAAAKANNKLVKVVANYGVREETTTLWGVDFVAKGKGDNAVYVAEVSAETAKSLIDAKRAVKAK
jgi:hypothetical protein